MKTSEEETGMKKATAQDIRERLAALRDAMREEGVDYLIIPTADFHNSEYVADYFRERQYFSGFSGSAGTLVVSQNYAALWTDGRYWVQAENEMKDTGVVLMRQGAPEVMSILDFLVSNMIPGQTLGFDGRCIPYAKGKEYKDALKKKGIQIAAKKDIGDKAWKKRPSLPCHKLFLLSEEYCGESCTDKLTRLRAVMQKKGTQYYVTSKLDDICWLTNLRGRDVPENPVALCHMLVTMDTAHLFLQEKEWTDETLAYAQKSGINAHPYDEFGVFLKDYMFNGNVLMDPSEVSYRIYSIVKKNIKTTSFGIVNADSPVALMKAVKNETEQKNIRDIYLEDSAAVCRFIYWLTHEADIENITELDAAKYLDNLRSKINGYIELSFGTIAAYGTNAAMMHYDPAKQTPAKLERKGMLLVDSGGTYFRGTTDVTRTTALGPVTDDMKKSYTLTAAGNLGLENAVFIDGCCGRNLDILAREPLWKVGSDYKCGTGHGIGFVLNVHEGPHGIRWRFAGEAAETKIVPGMIVSDEPGVYKEGEYGIRIETILLCVPAFETADGTFYKFDPLTFVPLDRTLLDKRYLTDEQIREVNEYHALCRKKLLPFFTDQTMRSWLMEQTEEL